MDGKVVEDETEVDYSAKYYASLAATSESNASTSETNAQSYASTAVSAKDDAVTAKNTAQTAATSASASATTATTKAGEASDSATTASTKASEASTSATNAATSATSAANSATAASGSASDAATSETNAGLSATSAATSATSAAASATNAATSETNAATSESNAEDAKDAAEAARDEILDMQDYYGLPIGYEYFTFNPSIPQGSLPLFGGEYSRDTYSDLWAWVQEQTGYLKTEAEWQTLSTANNGNVPYYSDGDGSTTFRVPSLKCWVRGANGTVTEVGSYLEAGLPNITGTMRGVGQDGAYDAFYFNTNVSHVPGALNSSSTSTKVLTLDASRSSAIYGNSTTVQPESIVGLWLVKAYGVIVDTGTIDEQQYIDDRIATRLPITGGTMIGGIITAESYFVKRDSDDSSVLVLGATDVTNGGYLGLYGKNHSTNAGRFAVVATDGSNTRILLGKPSGELTWGNKEIERVNASGTDYIRYESGLQICWGQKGSITTTDTTITFPVAFNSQPRIGVTATVTTITTSNTNETSFKAKTTSGSGIIAYIAVGYWK